MVQVVDSQQFETYVPVYDVIPEKWEDARGALTEFLKKVSNGINYRENALFIDSEILTGGQFIPTTAMSGPTSSSSEQFRSILRKVIDCSPLVAGANAYAHNVTFDSNFTLINSYVSATNSVTLQAITMVYPEVNIDNVNVNINSPGAYDRAFAVLEYIQEV